MDVQVTVDDDASSSGDDVVTSGDDVLAEIDGGGTGVYDVPPAGDVMTGCTNTCTPMPPSCLAEEICDDGDLNDGNGLDDNCDGRIDEGCTCIEGTVQRCFKGPPGQVDVGACQMGQQVCSLLGEIGSWGECNGGIWASGEVCDGLDNNCDGCPDDDLCCTANGTCPAPGDPRIPTGGPFQIFMLRGSDFLAGATRYEWHVEGGPCDQLLYLTSGKVSYELNGNTARDSEDATGETLRFKPTLSGDYTVKLTITRTDGSTLECTFIVPIRAPGFRVELCWNTTGTDDVDLWVHQPGNTQPWPGTGTSAQTCYYGNCKNVASRSLNWGFAASPATACPNPTGGQCLNPRLDVDNVGTEGIPENINVDNPNNNDRYRVAVNYYGMGFTGSGHTVRPMVNLYCGGALKATFGGANGIGATPVNNFNRTGDDSSGSLWRVADVVMMEPSDDCRVVALHESGMSTGYCVRTNTDRSYAGGCAPAP